MNPENDPLVHMLTDNEPEHLRRSYLAVPDGTIRAAGSTVRTIGVTHFRQATTSPLVIPSDATFDAPIDYVGVYVTLDQYFSYSRPDGAVPPEKVVEALAQNHTRETLLISLALLNSIASDASKLRQFQKEFLARLTPGVRVNLENLLAGGADGGRYQLLARQPLLAAIRYVLQNPACSESDDPAIPPLIGAAVFSQAVAVGLASVPDDTEKIVGVPAPLFFDIMRLGMMYESDDMWSSIDRVVRLWRGFGNEITTFPLRLPPAELLREASGLEIEEVLGLAFGLYAHATQWESGKPPFLVSDFGSDMAPAKLDAFRVLVSADTDMLQAAFSERTSSTFDYLPLQERPVLSTDAGLLVLDVGYLWDRVTSGLYWIVHDFEKKKRGDGARQRWSQAFAEAVELMAESQLRQMAPPILGGGTTFYTEENLAAAYGEMRRCDVAIDLGDNMLLVEIVSGQLSVPARIGGDLEQFKKDTDKLVIDKCRQLDAACKAVLDDAVALTGPRSATYARVVPLLIVGGGYPVNPFTMDYIRECLALNALLVDPRISELAIIDIGEMEVLEGLASRGENPVQILREWKESGIANVPLRNFILKARGVGRELRPERMDASVKATFRTVMSALKLRGPTSAPEDP